eukprot:jgi/Galph1/2204/GphlegSOOS_G883.1
MVPLQTVSSSADFGNKHLRPKMCCHLRGSWLQVNSLPSSRGKLHGWKWTKKTISQTRMTVIELQDDNFEKEVLQSELPVLVDFHADWCGPCKLVAPLLDWLVSEYKGKLRVAKVDTERNPRYVKEYEVRGLPTLIIFHHGKCLASTEGALGKKGIQQYLEKHLPELKEAGKQ